MKLEIRNLQSSSTYEIDPEGAILGREGSKADIVLRDQAVSKKHAKIYEKNGRWYLEDLASSNGTFIDNRRISEPVILTPGAMFALSENQFEVVQVLNGHNGAADSSLDGETDAADPHYQPGIDDLPPLGMTPPEESEPQGKRSPRPMGKNQSARLASPAQAGYDPADEGPAPGDTDAGVGHFFATLPKAIAHYLAAVPLMALNPVGSIRKGIAEQKFPAMGPWGLMAYAFPPLLFTSLVGFLAGLVVTLVSGHFSFGLIIPGPVGPVVAAIIGTVIAGFLFHPVTRWIIHFLKGESDDKSRTNWFIQSMTASALTAVPSAIAVLVALIRLPFVGIIPVVLMLAATLISFFVLLSWMNHFNVAGWVQKALMVVGILIVAGGGWQIFQVARFSMSGSPSPMVAGTAGDRDAALKELAKAGTLTPEQQEAIKKAQELAAKGSAAALAAESDAKKAGKAAEGGTQESQEALKKAHDEAAAKIAEAQAAIAKAQDSAGAGKKDADTALTSANAATADKEKQAEKVKPAQAANAASAAHAANARKAAAREGGEDAAAEVAAGVRPAAPVVPAGSTPFIQFLARREAVEKAINDDPALLRKADVRNSYDKYLRKTSEVRQKWAKKKKKDFATDKINDHFKNLDVFESTSKMVDELHDKIFR